MSAFVYDYMSIHSIKNHWMAKANPWSQCCKRHSLSNEGIFMILLPQYLTIEFNQVKTCFTFQQVLYFATLWIGILLVHSTFFYQSVYNIMRVITTQSNITRARIPFWIERYLLLGLIIKVVIPSWSTCTRNKKSVNQCGDYMFMVLEL